MAITNSQIRTKALASLKGQWGAAILIVVIYYVVSMTVACIPALNIASCLVTIPLSYGSVIWFLRFIRRADGSTPAAESLFDGFKDYIRIFTTLFLSSLYIFLWSLLLVIPGVIKALSYAMTPFILFDNPTLKNNEAIELSMSMMKGNKMKLFLMILNFCMWSFLSIFTLGIGMLWVTPYMQTTLAHFYEDVKGDFPVAVIA